MYVAKETDFYLTQRNLLLQRRLHLNSLDAVTTGNVRKRINKFFLDCITSETQFRVFGSLYRMEQLICDHSFLY